MTATYEYAPDLRPDSQSAAPVPVWATVAGALVVVLWLGCFVYGVISQSWLLLGPVVTVPLLFLIVRGIAGKIAAADNDPSVKTFVMGAFAVKIVGVAVRYFVNYKVYDGSDATEYDIWGKYLAEQFRSGDFGAAFGPDVSGTKFLRVVAGLVYTVSPSSRISGYLVFATFGFIGLVLFWRAFKLAVPTGDHHRYALFVLLLPSLIYWPSGMGKEAWMLLSLGLASWGAAALLTQRPVPGTIALAAGIGGVLLCRPHLGFVVLAGLMCAIVLRRNTSGSPFGTWMAIVMLVGLSMVVMKENKQFFSLESVSGDSLSGQLDATENRTGTGGSEFRNARGDTPTGFPIALVTVIYRPFPGEVGSATGLITGVECLAMLWITITSRKSLAKAFKAFRRIPYVAYCVGYLVMFVIAFSSFSNFGLLARQRSQVLPVFLALLTLVPRSSRDSDAELGSDDELGAAPLGA